MKDKFTEVYLKIITESLPGHGEDDVDAYIESDDYDEFKSRMLDVSEDELRFENSVKYDGSQDLQKIIGDVIYRCVTDWQYYYPTINLNKDYDLSVRYSDGSAPMDSKLTVTVGLDRYNLENEKGPKLEKYWKIKVGKYGEIFTEPFHRYEHGVENTSWDRDFKVTKEGREKNKQECFEAAKPIADEVKNIVQDLGKYE